MNWGQLLSVGSRAERLAARQDVPHTCVNAISTIELRHILLTSMRIRPSRPDKNRLRLAPRLACQEVGECLLHPAFLWYEVQIIVRR